MGGTTLHVLFFPMSGSAANNKRDGDEPAVTDNGLWRQRAVCENGDFHTQSGNFHIGTMIFCLFTNGFWGTSFSGKKPYVSVKCDEMLMWTLQVMQAAGLVEYLRDLRVVQETTSWTCISKSPLRTALRQDETRWSSGRRWDLMGFILWFLFFFERPTCLP